MDWYIDDNKLSHMDPIVNETIIEYVKKPFGSLTSTRGNKHAFLGMSITIREYNNIDAEIMEQVKDEIKSVGAILSGTVSYFNKCDKK